MNKLTKAQEKRLWKMTDEAEKGSMGDECWESYTDWEVVRDFLADELAKQRKEIIKLIKEAEKAGDQYGTLYELLEQM